MFNIEAIRKDFPVLDLQVYGKPLVYLDNAATTQRPNQVSALIADLYQSGSGNIHRGAHFLADRCTMLFEQTRDTVKEFINAESREEIIFTKGTTESINLVAFSFGERFINPGDEIILSEMEHHSNIVPWQLMCNRKGAVLKKLPFDENGVLEIDLLESLITEKTKIISVAHVSNVLGTVNPVKEIIRIAHRHQVKVLVDGAQAIQHLPVDVQDLDCDFYAFSGHKIYGPTGVGVLYGKKILLDEIPPYQGGGEMIDSVSFNGTTFNVLPYKFEAGTPNIIGVIGLGEAIRYVSSLGLENIGEHEHQLLGYLTQELKKFGGIKIYGEAPNKASVVAFRHEKVHPYDMGMLLDKLGVAVRTGRHCTDPLHERFGIDGTVRASLAVYNNIEDIDLFIKAMNRVVSMF
ncbi:MAG: cysteine desulfurase [Bacteroidota bacterium]|nr:cysteine desulfurase [Bacteroidota bacterium]